MRFNPHIQQQARDRLLQHLQELQCTLVAEKQECVPGDTLVRDYITVTSASGREHIILLEQLDLGKARSINIPQIIFNHQPQANRWILLALYMPDMMDALCYLVPTTVFKKPDDVFEVRNLSGRFHHLSTWEIKVFRNAIPRLSRYGLEGVLALDAKH
jgi:hypothetical protein